MNALRDFANAADCGIKSYEQQTSAVARPSSLTENLEERKVALEQQLSRVNAALEALKANPNFEEMINLLSQV